MNATRQEQKMTKDRSMAVGPYPTRVTRQAVTVEGSWVAGRYRTRIAGHHAVITLSDGSQVPCCDRPHGHKNQEAIVSCANRKVAALNDAAGIPEEAR